MRKAVGDDYPLMLDSTWSYDYTDAVRVGRAIEELGLLWFEDPLNEEDIYSYVKLREKLDIPIMATEYPGGDIGTYAVWLTERATDYLRGDIPDQRRPHDDAEDRAPRRGLPHDLRGAPRRQFAQQPGAAALCLAIRNTTYFEVLLPHGAHKYGLIKDIEIGKDGLAHCPKTPGIGAEIDFELIKRKQMAVLS